MTIQKRQIVQLDVPINNFKLPVLSLTNEELNLAKINSLSHWPALHEWGANEDNTGFKDRMFKKEILAKNFSNVSSRFFSAADGKKGYSIQNFDMALEFDELDDSGSFTIATFVGAECGFGSINAQPGNWFVGSNAGKIRLEISGAAVSSYDSYNGPLLDASDFKSVILILDRDQSIVKLRVDGQEVFSLAIDNSVQLPGELQLGAINVGTQQLRSGSYRAALVFNDALSGLELNALESYLNTLKD